ncbi:dihydrolipoyl dehydrogenase [Buchnera aphidicola (Aphis craccivora)]|uniref:Dihydrolipoyl dehydrogenase n=1 Tax=Buchnera aphidicola (Aphis craccivora) TaxID=466616 RepID=A0A4D6XJG0_9GAMM|nr:dihydrolipoyl dehydrogenase [Buchnera aphidicola]QCI16463.1 dihydrolipoyl dehydrogenase [Buchnera aphidicola (Aphis craccivora)]QLL40601.1 dihydrolipoyl dehydrogenase [Buchnera aphidicola (Aphis craccivore)]WAI17973.1 MAG: dihydrolipoyl dehydrogenase [Buchnera aphidicola (Aphis craccivora)]
MHQNIQAEVVVLGSGPAGYSAAFRCADLGLDTILIERYKKLGGVCLNVGCIPSKSLLHIAKVIKDADELSQAGVFFGKPSIDIKKIQDWKNHIISKLTDGLYNISNKRNIRFIQGKAHFESDANIIVENNHSKFNISFQNAIIATGSNPIKIPSFPVEDNRIWDSTDALSLKNIPNRFLIVGGGIIGLEMATIYSALGSTVDIVDRFNVFLPLIDQDVSEMYIKSINKRFNIFLNTHIKNVKPKENGLIVSMEGDHIHDTICYNNILVAIGRIPNIKHLGLDKIGIKLNDTGFINVDNQLRTNISNIYAIGDVTGFPMLAHKAIHESHIAAEVISGKNHYFEPKVIPSVAYTDPEIAWVGLNEKDAIKSGIDYEVAIFPWQASGRANASNCTIGMTKLIFNKQNNQIIGGSIVGQNAGELINEITLAIEMGCDTEDLSLTIHAHPTLSESICLASQIFQGTVTDLLNSKKNVIG